MTMRAPLSDLPIVLEDAAVVADQLTILNDIALTLAAGAPTVLVGPNGAGKTTLLRLAMGLVAPSRGRVTWGGRIDAASTRRAIVFQRPVMLRRSAAGNIRYALSAAGGARNLVVQVHDRNASGRVELHRAQHRPEQLEPPHVVAVVDHSRHHHRVDAGFERFLADLERPWRDA